MASQTQTQQPGLGVPGTAPDVRPQQCAICSRLWPWVVFRPLPDGTRDLSQIRCLRCEDPTCAWDRLVWRQARTAMTKAVDRARRHYTKNYDSHPHPAALGLPPRSSSEGEFPFSISVTTSAGKHVGTSMVTAATTTTATTTSGTSGPSSESMAASASTSATTHHQRPPPPTQTQQPAHRPHSVPSVPPVPTVPIPNHGQMQFVQTQGLAGLTEPERAIAWLRAHYRPAPPPAAVRQVDVYMRYQAHFARTPIRLISGVEFVRLIPHVFPTCQLTHVGYECLGLVPIEGDLATNGMAHRDSSMHASPPISRPGDTFDTSMGGAIQHRVAYPVPGQGPVMRPFPPSSAPIARPAAPSMTAWHPDAHYFPVAQSMPFLHQPISVAPNRHPLYPNNTAAPPIHGSYVSPHVQPRPTQITPIAQPAPQPAPRPGVPTQTNAERRLSSDDWSTLRKNHGGGGGGGTRNTPVKLAHVLATSQQVHSGLSIQPKSNVSTFTAATISASTAAAASPGRWSSTTKPETSGRQDDPIVIDDEKHADQVEDLLIPP
ncbi:hypothetical protein EHS25_009867 [Saitozyma podzolica]|uniref:RFX-type winged-helix domain-containing protein n=1 Tax=Saitozyma podzolica TaxID=1890683 RepID=A0A427YKE3_9TREE|nr:hypothetical protein EHS25_009867 [Saitozyma podzolica]